MILNQKTLEKLRDLINEETEYRSGPKLIKFFNSLGFIDSYRQGFPSRWQYTDEKLRVINGTPRLTKCIENLFAPINFVGQISELDNHISELNQYMTFDKWQVVRQEATISLRKTDQIKMFDENKTVKEVVFLEKEFEDVSLEALALDGILTETLKSRYDEIKKCFSAQAYLSVIFMSGSTLEGVLLGAALNNPKDFNQATSSPKDKTGQCYNFQIGL